MNSLALLKASGKVLWRSCDGEGMQLRVWRIVALTPGLGSGSGSGSGSISTRF